MFCPQLTEHLGRPLQLKKCLYGADFSGKSWYDTLDTFLQKEMGFHCSRVEGISSNPNGRSKMVPWDAH